MNRVLNYESHHVLHLYHHDDLLDGVQYIFKFTNHFGASVIKHKGSYGYERDRWELAVIYFYNDHDWDITYNTDIADDVIGNITDDEVNKFLNRIQNLDRNGKETTEDETEQD